MVRLVGKFMTKNLELAKKALAYVKEKRWDYLLVHAFLETQHYHAWSKRGDFEDEWNIGLRNISSEKKPLVCDYLKEETTFLKATYNDINFEIGGFSHSFSAPDGDYSVTFACSLIIDGQTVLTAMYSEKDTDAYFPRDFSIFSVEELHVDMRIDDLLNGIETLITQHVNRREQRESERRDKKYEGKFTFGDD